MEVEVEFFFLLFDVEITSRVLPLLAAASFEPDSASLPSHATQRAVTLGAPSCLKTYSRLPESAEI